MAENYTDTGVEEAPSPELDYHALNAQLNLYDADGRIQFDADRKAARQYFLQHVNQNTVFFHDLEEKLKVLSKEAPDILKGNLEGIKQAVSNIESAEKEAKGYRSKLADLEGLKKRFDQLHKQIDQLSRLHR